MSKSKFVIAGFDPASTRNIGWSIIELTKNPHKSKNAKISHWEGGTFVLPTMEKRWEVLWPMFTLVDLFITEKKPDLVMLEKTNQFRQKSGGFVTGQVSHCMGVIYAVCGKNEVDIDFAYPTSVKKTVAGHGRATKSQVKKSVKKLLSAAKIPDVTFDSDHSADAAATIFYWMITGGIVKALEGEETR